MRRSIGAVLLLLGCSPKANVVWVSEPSSGRSMILAVGTPPTLYAVTLGQGGLRLPDPLPPDGTQRLEALVYQETLDQLGLSEGVVAPSQSAQASRTLPGGATVWTATVSVSQSTAWAMTETLSPTLARMRILKPADRCQDFQPRVTELAADRALFAAPIDQDSVLLASADGKLFRFHRTDWVENEYPGVPMKAGVAIANGEVWLATEAGVLWRASLDSTVIHYQAMTASSASGQTPHWIAGGRTADGVEIYTLSVEGALDRWDGTRSQTVFAFDTPSAVSALLWNGPGELLAIRSNDSRVLRIHLGAATLEPLEHPDTTPAGLLQVPGLGNVICGAPGELLADSGTGWHAIGVSGLSGGPCPMLLQGDGFWYGGGQGLLGQWNAHALACGPMPLSVAAQVEVLAPLGPDLVLLAGDKPEGSGMLPVTTLSRITPPGS